MRVVTRRGMRMRQALAGTAVLGMALVGCGDDGNGPGTSPERDAGRSGSQDKGAGGRFDSDKALTLKDELRTVIPDEATNAPRHWDSGPERRGVSAGDYASRDCGKWDVGSACQDVKLSGEVNFDDKYWSVLSFGSKSAAQSAFQDMVSAEVDKGERRKLSSAPLVGSESATFTEPGDRTSSSGLVRTGTVVVHIDYRQKEEDPAFDKVMAFQADLIRQKLEGGAPTAKLS